MSVTYPADTTDKVTTYYVRITAKALVAEGTFPRSDFQDVIQELQLALLEQVGNFDPAKSRWSTFVKHVVRMSAVSLRRRQRAQCRQAHCELHSLNVLVVNDVRERATLGEMISEEEQRTGQGQDFVSHTEEIDLAIDVDAVLDGLAPELRTICEKLKYQTLTEARRELGISRTTMDRRIALLRQHFCDAGITDVV